MSKRREKSKVQQQLNKQLEQPMAVKSTHSVAATDVVAKELGKFCYDVAKLIIGGVILAGLMNQDIAYYPLAFFGLIAVMILIVYGPYLIKKSTKTT